MISQTCYQTSKSQNHLRTLVHHSSKSIDNKECHQLWIDISTILISFDDIETELDKLKEDSIFDLPKQIINEENTKEALRLKSLGIEAYDKENYSEAIKFFIKATDLSGVSDHDRAIFFLNMAASRVASYKQQLYSGDG
ncbi:unnamed protein product, partial [Adineta ricciae]